MRIGNDSQKLKFALRQRKVAALMTTRGPNNPAMNKKLLELREYVENLWEAESMEEMQAFYKGLVDRIDALLQELAKTN